MTSEAASYLSEYFCRKTDQQEALVDEELSEENINEAQEVLWRVCRGIEPIAALSRIEKDEYDVEAIEPLSGWRALHLAVGISGNAAIATMLLVEMGADPNSRSTESTGLRSPLHVAAACGHYQSCDVLLKHNARSGARTTDGRTALHLAAESDSFETLKLMVRASKEIDPRDDMGRTPLHLACANQVASVDAVQLLLQRGAQPDAVDAQGRIPLDILKKVVQKSAIIRTIAKLLGGTLDESQSDLLENKSDDKEKQIWILITKENTPKMLETSERKVALFISARSALDWYQKQMLNMKKPPMIPARVTNIHKLQSQVPTERIFYQEEDDDDDDPHMTDFVRKTKAEKQAEEETSKIRYIVQQKQQKLQLLKTQIAETSRKAKTCNAKSISLNDECQKLEELVTSLHTELRSSKLGSQIVDAALDLAATGHPAAVTNDPQRLATAAAHHLAYKRRLAILLSQADAAVAAAKLADAKLEAELQAKKIT
uniref:Uncharacterized protein n=1 Tax=Aureoumbra lagunensis TaxID=44058 RepID=A0A7S3NLY0_9STRA